MRSLRPLCGFTYLGLLIAVAIIALAATATVQIGAVAQRRDAELELLHLAHQFAGALRSYLINTPAGRPALPKELEDLLKDPRSTDLRRHLRRIPVDPLTGEAKWGLVRTPDGFIAGVHSLSEGRPIKVANFEREFSVFEGKEKYSEWVFAVTPFSAKKEDAGKKK